MSQPYPLEALVRLQDDALEAAERALTEASQALHAARALTLARQQTLDAHHVETRASQRQPTSVAEAQTQHAWQTRRREEAALLVQELEAAQQIEQAHQQAEAAARAEAREVLEAAQPADKHQTGWETGDAQAKQAVQEREADERRR